MIEAIVDRTENEEFRMKSLLREVILSDRFRHAN
jgi:hypothetical protein